MNKVFFISIIVIFALLCGSCHTFTLSNGKKYRQAFPAKDKSSLAKFDTGRYIIQAFHAPGYNGTNENRGNKRIITPVYGRDVKKLPGKGEYYLYFCNPTCPSAALHIKRLDSLSKAGKQILILSLRNNYELLDEKLSRTTFARYPLYIISGEKPSNILLQRQVDFIKEACGYCYQQYKDDLIFAQYLLVGNDSVKVVFDTSKENILH